MEVTKDTCLLAHLNKPGASEERLMLLGLQIAAVAHLGAKGPLAAQPKRMLKDPQLVGIGTLMLFVLRDPEFLAGLNLDAIPGCLPGQCQVVEGPQEPIAGARTYPGTDTGEFDVGAV